MITEARTIQIAIFINLGAAHKANIDVAALQQQQNIRNTEKHVGSSGASLLIGRWWQFSGNDEWS